MDDSAGPAQWVTVTEIDGLRLDMPRRPHHATAPIPGTDVVADTYQARFDHIEVAVAVVSRPGGDTRTDDESLADAAEGAATNIGGTIVDSRQVQVDGAHGLDVEVTTPREGGRVVLARFVLTDDRVVMVETVFDPDDRDAATSAHDRMARSLQLE